MARARGRRGGGKPGKGRGAKRAGRPDPLEDLRGRIDTVIVARSRLFTPIIMAPQPTARSASSSECTSTRGSMCSERATPISVPRTLVLRIRAIRRIESAPRTRLSYTWYSSRMKSFLRTGTETARFASPRCSGAPRKKPASVRTESAAAPARS